MAPKNCDLHSLKGSAASSFIAELLVDEHGDGAREKCSGPMLADVNAVIVRRAKEQADGGA